MKCVYRCPVVGTGVGADDFRPSLAKHQGISWKVCELFLPGAKSIVVEVDANLAQHALITADTAIEVIL